MMTESGGGLLAGAVSVLTMAIESLGKFK